jgi:multiple antibiotic resistance protein
MPHQIVDSFITFLVVLDPIGVAVIFAGLMRGAPGPLRRRMAWRSTLIAAILLFGFAAGGALLFDALGISLPAFRIAGGLLLFLLATDMVFARHSGIRNPTRPEQEEAADSDDISVFPLAFPLLAGPGALTSVVLLIGRAETQFAVAAVVGSLIAVLALTLVALLAADRLMRVLGVTGANVVGRVLGIILAALAAQFVIDGIEGMLH